MKAIKTIDEDGDFHLPLVFGGLTAGYVKATDLGIPESEAIPGSEWEIEITLKKVKSPLEIAAGRLATIIQHYVNNSVPTSERTLEWLKELNLEVKQ